MRRYSLIALLLLASLPVKAADEGAPLRLTQPPLKAPLGDPRSDELNLDSPFYIQDPVKAAMARLKGTPLGPPDLADYDFIDRMDVLGQKAAMIAATPRHTWDMLGMRCEGLVCRKPGSSCVISLLLLFAGCKF